MVLNWLRLSIVPFLLLAYPLTFFIFQGGRYCTPMCFEPTVVGVSKLFVTLLALLLIAVVIATALRFNERGDTRQSIRWLISPPPLANVVLLGFFTGFVSFLTLDSLSIYEAIWKPVILPITLLVFPPVWILYIASYPISVLFTVLGIEFSTVVTLAYRSLTIGIGFPLSVIYQAYIISEFLKKPQMGNDSHIIDERTNKGQQKGFSGWWILLALNPIWFVVVLLYLQFNLEAYYENLIFVIGGGFVFLTIAFPISLYLDIKYIRSVCDNWRPNTGIWILIAGFGLLIPFIHEITSVIYLYNRHKFLGTP